VVASQVRGAATGGATLFDRGGRVPALLSFFIPGLGQFVKGDILKGIAAFVAIGWVTTPVIWLWQLYDACTSN